MKLSNMDAINKFSVSFSKVKKTLFIAIFIIMHLFILRNVLMFGRDMLYGDKAGENIIPTPLYGLKRIPDTSMTRLYEAQNRLASDFASLYFPAKQMKILGRHYINGNLDPWNSLSSVAPFIYYVCSKTICKLNYGAAIIADMGLQYLLFLAVYIFSFRILKIEKCVWVGILLVNFYLFLTPTGLAWLERGQYYLFLGTAYLVIILGFIKRNNLLILLSAPLAFIRWTSLPFMVVGFASYLFNSKNLAEARKKFLTGAVFVLVFIALTFSLPSQSLLFLNQLLHYENSRPDGVGLATIAPLEAARVLLFLIIITGGFSAKIYKRVFDQNIPFLAGAAIGLLTFATASFEYSLVSLLGLIPLLIYWAEQASPLRPVYERQGMLALFLAFMLSASFSRFFPVAIIYEYLLVSLIFFALPFYFYWRASRNPALGEPKSAS